MSQVDEPDVLASTEPAPSATNETGSMDSFLAEVARLPIVEPPPVGPPGERLLAGRYRLLHTIGRGAQGEVWEADDQLTRERVAVKILRRVAGSAAARVRREVAALRLLRLPGVLRLIDEGVENGQIFLVMELVRGTPFPGVPLPCAFSALAGPLAALLEALSRVHAMGVVHRDLKPANVLVGSEGRVTILDFGLSHFDAPALDGLTEEGQVLGTPAYLAPEQVSAGAITARTDLYAVGVMAYVSLTGRVPHDAPNLVALLFARLHTRSPPLRDLCPDVPASVAAVIDQLLAIEPADRPRSASEVLERLRGQRPPAGASSLPRLGTPAPLDALVAAVAAGRSVDVVGPHGAGRSRLLDDLETLLAARGMHILRATPASAPFASLSALLGTLDDHGAQRLDDVSLSVDRAVRGALGGGAVILADDTERLDTASAAALERCRDAGAIVCAKIDAPASTVPLVTLAPLEEAALRPLFAGPDRLFHLREDAARALFARTSGLPAHVAEEVSAWVQAGLARWDGARLVVERSAIERLESMGRAPLRSTSLRGPTLRLPPRLADLLTWIGLAGPGANVELLAAVMREPLWRVEAEVLDLVTRGAVRLLPNARIEPCVDGGYDASWAPDRTQAAYRAIAAAEPPGAPGRLSHLLAGGGDSDADLAVAVAREALVTSERLAEAGHLGRAMVPLGEGLRALRRSAPEAVSDLVSLLSLAVEIALQEGTAHARDRVLYELCRPGPRPAEVVELEALVRAAIAVGAWTPRAAQMADALPPFADVRLELRRFEVRVLAARRISLDREEQVLAEVARWVEASGSAAARTSLACWKGRLAYCRGRFEEAAALNAEAADGEAWLTIKIDAQIEVASALMEAFRLDEAAAWAAKAAATAAACRHALFEGFAEWLSRTIAYRAGRTDAGGTPDRELVEASGQLGASHLESLVRLTEAAVAYRAGDHAAARTIGEPGYRLWAESGHPVGPLVLGALIVACGAALHRDEVASLVERALRCEVPGLGPQALALLAQGGVALPKDAAAVRALAEIVPAKFWDQRMDVLTIYESLERLC